MALKVAFKSFVASRFLYPTIITGIKVVPIKKIFLQASSYPLFLADSMGGKRIVSFEKSPSLEIIIHSTVVATQPLLFLYLKCISLFLLLVIKVTHFFE